MTESVCQGCEHSLGRHFMAVDGTVRCVVAWTDESTTGVIGLRSDHSCDCVDYLSANTELKRRAEAKRREPFDRLREACKRAGIKQITLGEKQ